MANEEYSHAQLHADIQVLDQKLTSGISHLTDLAERNRSDAKELFNRLEKTERDVMLLKADHAGERLGALESLRHQASGFIGGVRVGILFVVAATGIGVFEAGKALIKMIGGQS